MFKFTGMLAAWLAAPFVRDSQYPDGKYELIYDINDWEEGDDDKVHQVNILDKYPNPWDIYRNRKGDDKDNWFYLEPKPENGHEYTFIFIHGAFFSSEWSL